MSSPRPPSSVAQALRNAKYSSAPTRNRQSASLMPVLLVILCIVGGIFAYHMLQGPGPETPEMASQALAAQNIDISENGFIDEIKAGHTDNVRRFLMLGTSAITQNKDGVVAFTAGIESGNLDIVNLLLGALPEDPAEVQKLLNAPDAKDKTPLMQALDKHNPALLSLLLNHGADLTLSNHAGETPLIYAIKHLTAEDAERVIAEDMRLHQSVLSMNIPDSAGDTPLFYAIRHHDDKIIALLLKSHVDVTQPDGSGITPLMICAEAGDITTAQQLLASGAKLDVADKGGNTPLSVAIRNNRIEFAKFLIDSGADPDFHTTGLFPIQIVAEKTPVDSGLVTYFLSRSHQARTAAPELFFASIDHKDAPIVNYLLESHLANPNSVNTQGETAFYHALESGDESIALMLINAGADINKTGVSGITPLVLCIEHHMPSVAKMLIDRGAQINQRTSQGYNLAEMAVYYDEPILGALLDKGAVLNKEAALMASVRDGKGRVVPTLLAHGAKPNIMNTKGDSILWIAANNGQDEAVDALVRYHAVIDDKNKEFHMTPLAAAAQAGHVSTVKLLVESGASLEAVDDYGMTPLAHAVYIANPEMVAYLISKGANTQVKDGHGKSLADLAGLGVDNQDARDAILRLLTH